MSRDARPLIVSATRAEAAHVPDGFRVLICGIGKVEAALATAMAIATERPSVVINIGTAGSLNGGTGLFRPSRVLNHDFSAELIRSLGAEAIDEIELDDGDGTALATGDEFVTDPVRRDLLAQRAVLVDMEGFAIARAANVAGVPVRLIKHVSDQADESALDWPGVVEASARILAGALPPLRDRAGL